MSEQGTDQGDRARALLGTLLMTAGSILAVLIFCDRTGEGLPGMPAIWYSSRGIHLALCGSLFVAAAVLLKSPPGAMPQPLFETLRLYTRRDCPLCDHALEILDRYSSVLPEPELIDIDEDPELQRRYGDSVPVVELDGQERFRGTINPELLKRLIDAAWQRQQAETERSLGSPDAADQSQSGL